MMTTAVQKRISGDRTSEPLLVGYYPQRVHSYGTNVYVVVSRGGGGLLEVVTCGQKYLKRLEGHPLGE
jgi:hypothetical protein